MSIDKTITIPGWLIVLVVVTILFIIAAPIVIRHIETTVSVNGDVLTTQAAAGSSHTATESGEAPEGQIVTNPRIPPHEAHTPAPPQPTVTQPPTPLPPVVRPIDYETTVKREAAKKETIMKMRERAKTNPHSKATLTEEELKKLEESGNTGG